MNSKELISKIDEWMEVHGYPFICQEDLVEERTGWEELRDKALDAYYLLLELKGELAKHDQKKLSKLDYEDLSKKQEEKWKKIEENFDNVNWDELREKYAQEERIKNEQKEKVAKYIDSLSEENIEKEFLRFLEWEDKFEERYYKKFIHTSSSIFYNVIEALQTRGKAIKSNEDFLSGGFKWNGYTFKLFCGQGCFWRISKGKKVIFQNS